MSATDDSSKTSATKAAPSAEQRRIVDPLGEIERLARNLCKDDTAHRSSNWEDYWSDAEEVLLKGLSGQSVAIESERKNAPEQLSPELAPLLSMTDSKLLPVLAQIFLKPINEHEAVCLGYVLQTNTITWKGDGKQQPLSAEECGVVLSHLCFEYSSDFLTRHPGLNATAIPIDERARYWASRLQQVTAADEPLNYASQNTIRRIRDSIAGLNTVEDVEFSGPTAPTLA